MIKAARHLLYFLVLTGAFFSHQASAQMSVGHEGATAQSPTQTYPEFHIMGFGDISYVSRDASSTDGFGVGQAVAHLSASLDDRLQVFGEFSMTARDTDYKTSVERLIVRYDFSDTFKLSGGRYHSPIGYWNSAFHHGAWLQTTTSRPEMAKFGSKIMPIHFVGVLLEGSLPQNKLGLSYSAGFGNGRHADVSQAGDAGDINSDNAWMLQVKAAPTRFFGLKTGIGFYADTVSPSDRPDINEQTYSVFAVWEKESPEIIIEFLHSDHEFVANSAANGSVDAWYAQFAYRLKGKHSQWKPYLRYERNEIDDSDPLLGDQGLNYEGTVLGVRWDFSAYAAIKAEYRNEEFNNSGREDNFRLQVSFVLAKL
jgi:hypothetical protein